MSKNKKKEQKNTNFSVADLLSLIKDTKKNLVVEKLNVFNGSNKNISVIKQQRIKIAYYSGLLNKLLFKKN